MIGIFSKTKRVIWAALWLAISSSAAWSDELYGPPNLIKTMKTPFGAVGQGGGKDSDAKSEIGLISISSPAVRRRHRSLAERLVPSAKVYLPGRMFLGKPAEFMVKGEPGKWAAIAMSESNSGAKPIFGHEIHLGADRKTVGLSQIPETGVATIFVDTPIQGDLIGQNLYFEAAVWGNPDLSDTVIADPVSDGESKERNAVLIAGQQEPHPRKGIRFVPDSGGLPSQRQAVGIDSGRP